MIERDLSTLWHPCSQMKDYETFPPLEVVGASGSELILKDGRCVIDAISSWWCKSLGHQHPRLKAALASQLDRFEHVMLANLTHEAIVTLSEQLTQLSPGLTKVFYASEGSSAVEIALKLSLHMRYLQGENRHHFIALQNGYHGETAGALSVSDVGLYREPYRRLLFQTHILHDLPYVHRADEPLWQNCEAQWQALSAQLEPFKDSATALIVEPLLQGAGGMKIYSPDLLRRLRAWTAQHHIHLIADEIMTGIGRTGRMLACEHAGIEPDLVCLSKGLTGGVLPLSAVLMKQYFYDACYDDYAAGKSFLHSHTFSGNPLAARVAVEVLKIVKEEKLCDRATTLGEIMCEMMCDIANETGQLKNIRSLGAMVAADLICEPTARYGFKVFQAAMQRGAFLRPLGNTIYWLPPLNTTDDTLTRLKQITTAALVASKKY
jgi:adenosylmethionine-8-amino-7-oxononanoate aminotransferase